MGTSMVNFGRCVAACTCIAFARLPTASQYAHAEESTWRVEKERMNEAMCDGDYQRALELARTFEKELKKSKSSYKAKYNWAEHEAATIDAHLTIGNVHRVCGNYGESRYRFDLALSELQQQFRRNIKRLEQVAPAAAAARADASRAEARAQDAAAEREGAAVARLAAAAADWEARAAEGVRDDVANVARTAARLGIETYDGLGALALDRALPLSRASLKHLNEAEKYFRLAQNIRESSGIGVDGNAFHGSQRVTFLLNFGNVFLRRAQLKMIWPECPPGEQNADALLDRAADYFEMAGDEFSTNRHWLEDFQQVVGNGTVAQAEEALLEQMLVQQPLVGRDQHRREVRALINEHQRMVFGGADLDFKNAELKVARIMLDHLQNRLPNVADLNRAFADAEEDLKRAIEAMKLVDARGEHPYLVMCYSALASLEANRAKLENRMPNQRYRIYLADSTTILEKHHLSEESAQNQYLKAASDLW